MALQGRPQGPKAWNLGDFDKASASIKHSRKRSAAAKDWGSMASGIHGGKSWKQNIGATSFLAKQKENQTQCTWRFSTKHNMIWYDMTLKKKHEKCGWNPIYHGFFTRIYGISMGFPVDSEGQRKTARPRRKCRRPGCWSTSRLSLDGGFSVDRWIGEPKMDDFSGRFSWIFFWNVGKTMENPSFLMAGFWIYQKPTIFKGQQTWISHDGNLQAFLVVSKGFNQPYHCADLRHFLGVTARVTAKRVESPLSGKVVG